MDVAKVFHMKQGQGEASYARNSSAQRKGLELVKQVTEDAVVDVYLCKAPQCLAIADLGCSSGPNTLSVIQSIIDVVDYRCHSASRPTPEFQVLLNDLPTNDFNSIFIELAEFYSKIIKKDGEREDPPSVFISGVPGSFYGRLFPTTSLHFIHSSYSVHWLSRVPPAIYDESGNSMNKGKMCVTPSSPPEVAKAYLKQFQEDFGLFLKLRSEELISGGRMVLTMLGRSENHMGRDQAAYWELLAQAFACLVSSGEVEQEKVDTYDVHFYAPSMKEVKGVVQMEGSFSIDCLQMFEVGDANVGRNGRATAKAIRAIQEPMILHHFGGGIIDSLFERFAQILDVELAKEEIRAPNLLVVLRKII